MKKLFAALLILAMLLPCTLAAADGVMTDKPINYAEFVFGDTYGNIRWQLRINSISFKYGAFTSRCVADALEIPNYSHYDRSIAPCFKVQEEGMRTVAGHNAGAYLWFAYPAGDYFNDYGAMFYAGEYEFETYERDGRAVFDDVKDKLEQVYGEPFYAGGDLSAVMGEVAVDDVDRYNKDMQENQAEYAVWKSSANNAVAVLKYYKAFGDWERTILCYIADIADAALSQYNTELDDADFSLEGL